MHTKQRLHAAFTFGAGRYSISQDFGLGIGRCRHFRTDRFADLDGYNVADLIADTIRSTALPSP